RIFDGQILDTVTVEVCYNEHVRNCGGLRIKDCRSKCSIFMAQKDSDRAAVSHHHGQIGIAIPIKVSNHGHQGSTALGGKLERIGSRLKGAIPFSQKNGDRMAELIQYGQVRYPISVE